MEVTYVTDGRKVTVDPALLVIACDPRSLGPVMSFTPQEKSLLSALQNFTFFTTCLRVRPRRAQDRIVILDPEQVEPQAGLVQGYRNETAKQWGLTAANRAGTNVVTIYQMVGIGGDTNNLAAQRTAFLDQPPAWWPFQPGVYEIVQVQEDQNGTLRPATNPLRTPYFNQFPAVALQGGAPWAWLDIQGDNDTVYVHASTCFESVLHCWSYLDILLTAKPELLEGDKGRPIVVIGAGVSGLLFAERFRSAGFTNVTLLESTDRYAGKTHSLQVPDQNATTIAELGTCYLSPAYDDMVDALAPYTVGNCRVPVAHGTGRGIVTRFADGHQEVLSFADYGLKVACDRLGIVWPCSEPDRLFVEARLAAAAGIYLALRTEIFRSLDGVMPASRPEGDPFGVFTTTFQQFLDHHGMGVLTGYLVYAYQVQGYGDLDKIPAYYGLVWVTPDMALPVGPTAGVTGWAKGWEDVWDQLVAAWDLDIRLNTQVVSIRR